MICHNPSFYCTVSSRHSHSLKLSLPINWKRRTDGNFELSFITSALDTRDLLGSRPGRFIRGETGQYKLTRRLCGPQRQCGSFGGDRKHSPLPEIEPWNRRAQSLIRRPTAPFFFKKSLIGEVRNLLTNGCCYHSCSFVHPSLSVLGVMYFISSCQNVSKLSIRDRM
jgi:hypothetical protein